MKSFILFFIFCISSLTGFANIDFNSNCKKAYTLALSLKFDEMQSYLDAEKNKNPDNAAIICIKTYSNFLAYILTEKDSYNQDFIKNYDLSIAALEKENNTNPYKKYLLTDLYLQYSFINVLKSNYLSAAMSFKNAYSSIHENEKLFPEFIPNKKALGIINIGIGSIPKSYNWVLKILNIDGDVNTGNLQLKTVLLKSENDTNFNYLFVEDLVLYTFIQKNYSSNISSELENIFTDKSILSKYKNNQIFAFSKASYFQYKNQNEKVITTLSDIQNEFSSNNIKIYYLDFMFGESLLYKQDEKSEFYFNRYIKDYPGVNYLRATKQKLSWIALIDNNYPEFNNLKTQIINSKGGNMFDADKQALIEAKKTEIPNIYLLKSRLFFDGGYYTDAENILRLGFINGSYKSQSDKIEYIYRLARIYDESNNFTLAEIYYKTTIDQGKNLKYYFAANSALNLGLEYEKLNRKTEAKEMFKLCLTFDFDEYQNSITQKAKAGLNRIK